MKEWDSLTSMFEELNHSGINYLVLRNYEELINDRLDSSHSDIDFLCDDISEFIRISGAVSRSDIKFDLTHSFIKVSGNIIYIDIRTVGDGYYDATWEKDMLESREFYKDIFYVMNLENYYYSLCYHALVHKMFLSEDYKIKIKKMGMKLKLDENVPIRKLLEEFMKTKGYLYTYPRCLRSYVNLRNADAEIIENNLEIKMKRFLYKCISKIGGLKYRIQREIRR